MTFPFVPGYPQDNSTLGQSKTTIRNNLNGTFSTLGIDHINNNGAPGAQPAGYHNVTRWVPKSADPARVPNYGQLYSKTVGAPADQQLFWETGVSGAVQQITSSFATVSANNGRVPLAGGLLLQWGRVDGTHGGIAHQFNGGDTGNVTFATTGIAFPNNCFNVWTQPFYTNGNNPGSASTATVAIRSDFTRTDFTWFFTTVSATYTRFIWFAIGN